MFKKSDLKARITAALQARSCAAYSRAMGFDGLFTLENHKLVPNETTRFLIFNIPAVSTCPGRTPDCEKFCYADGAEKFREEARIHRRRNYLISSFPEFVELAVHEIELRLNTPNFRKAKKIYVRIHESGDFYSRKYLEKWLAIMKHFAGDPRITFAFYTKSFDMFSGITLPENAAPTGSLWAMTHPGERAKLKELKWHVYSADTPENIAARKAAGEKIHICRCSDCARCGFCYSRKDGMRTECEIH